MIRRSLALVCLVTALALAADAPTAFAQGANASVSGTVVDSAGGAIPGAAVIVSNESGASFETVTNAEGVFNVPAVAAGTYKVTVSLTGFKTAVVDVRVLPGTPAAVKAVLEVGAISETVNVSSSSELINTQSPVVAATRRGSRPGRHAPSAAHAVPPYERRRAGTA